MCSELGYKIEKTVKYTHNALKEVDKHEKATILTQLSKKHTLAKCKQRQQLFKLYEKRQKDISAMNTNALLLKSASRDKRDNSKTKSSHSYHTKVDNVIHKYKHVCKQVKEEMMGPHGCLDDICYPGNMLFFPDYLYQFII